MGVMVYCGLGFDGVYGSMELGLFPDVPERSDEGAIMEEKRPLLH